MSRVNLLPPESQREQRRRLSRGVRRTAAAAFAALIAAWLIVAVVQARGLDRAIEEAEASLQEAREGYEARRIAHDDYERMLRKVRHLSWLREPAPIHGVLALLSQTLQGEIALERLAIEAAPELLRHPNEARRSAASGPPSASLRVELEGLAETDTAIPLLIDRLTDQDLFSGVRVLKHQADRTDARAWQRFVVSMRVPIASGTTTEERADATHP